MHTQYTWNNHTHAQTVTLKQTHTHTAKPEEDKELQQADSIPPDLDGSTSSGDIPKSKLDPRQETKRLDLETTVLAPGRKRNVSPPVEPESINDDLRISISNYEKHGSKNDFFIMYKICTEVCVHLSCVYIYFCHPSHTHIHTHTLVNTGHPSL